MTRISVYVSNNSGFFSENAMNFFQISKSQKNIFQKTILSLKFKFPTNNTLLLLAGNLNFKFRIVFWNIFFLRFEKQIALSERMRPLEVSCDASISTIQKAYENLTHKHRSTFTFLVLTETILLDRYAF